MPKTVKLSRLEYQLMEILWERGEASIRDIQTSVSDKRRPAYTTIQTTIFRMEEKGIVGNAGRSGAAYLFRPLITRRQAQRALIDDLLSLFGGQSQPVMAHLVESGKLSLDDVKAAEQVLRSRKKGDA